MNTTSSQDSPIIRLRGKNPSQRQITETKTTRRETEIMEKAASVTIKKAGNKMRQEMEVDTPMMNRKAIGIV